MSSRLRRAGVLLAFVIATGAGRVTAQSNDFGMQGVIDIPSARMEPEGTFTVVYSRKDVADIYAIAYQVLPRVEASFRYTIFNARELAESSDTLKDRSFEIKVNLFEETQYLPAISLGIRDLLGTGAWGAEYLAASKAFGALDVTLGLGWGRMGERGIAENPLSVFSDRFLERSGFSGLGGEFSLDSYFRGPEVGLFGGLRYRIPAWRLDLLAAYNSDSYARERALGTIDKADPWSVGLDWEATPGIRFGVSWQQGNQLALKFSSALDTRSPSPRKRPERFGAGTSPPAPVRADLAPGETWWPRLVNDAEASGLLLYRARERLEEGVLELDYRNRTYQYESDAIRRVLALTDLYVSPEIREIVLTGDAGGQPTHSLRYRRPAADTPPVLTSASRIDWLPPQPIEAPTHETLFQYPNGDVSLSGTLRYYIFDPDAPFLYQISVSARAQVDFGRGWSMEGTWVQSLKSQFDRIRRGSDSQLPPVRTLSRDYLQQGKSGIESLALVNRGKWGNEVYYQAYAGILEEMFSGAGAEVLWRPHDRRWALGLNVIGVRQREFDKRFGLRDYRTVTAHASAYWASPFYNLDFALHAGRYLAKDVGATLEIQKRFANGWSVGAFATLTDVPFEVFGEGSFDKGLIFRIPFDPFTPRNTAAGYRAIIRSINRDGGRMVDQWPGNLWERLRRTHPDWLRETEFRMIPE